MQPTNLKGLTDRFSSFWRKLFDAPSCSRGSRKQARRHKPSLEMLEDRLAPAACLNGGQDFTVGDLQFCGDFQYDGNDWVTNTSNSNIPVLVGFIPQGTEQFNPLLSIKGEITIPDSVDEPDETEFTIGPTGLDSATISIVPAPPLTPNTVWELKTNESAATFDTNLLGDVALGGQIIQTGTPTGFTVAGVTSGLLANNLLLFNPGGTKSDSSDATVRLKGNMHFDALGLVGLSVGADGPNYVEIDSVTRAVTLTGINAEVNTGKFTFGGVGFSAGLGASYTPANNEFGFFGDISFSAAGLEDNNGGNFVNIRVGTDGADGLVVTGGHLDKFAATVTGQLQAYKLSIEPKALTFEYDDSADTITIHGGLAFKVPDGSGHVEDISGNFGTKEEPGLIIDVKSGVAQQVNVGVSGKFDFLGFELEIPASNPAHFLYKAADDLYELSGQVSAPQLWNTTVVMGSESQPGIKIEDGNWSVDNLTVGFGNVEIGGFGVRNISVTYSQFKNLQATGDLTIGSRTIMNAASSGDLTELKPGQLVRATGIPAGTKILEVDGNQIKLNNGATANATGEALTFDGGIEVDAKGSVQFPQEWIVSGDLDFLYDEDTDKLFLNEISLKAQNLFIEIGDTGFFLSEIDATVNNLNSSDWVISGHVTVDYGKDVKIYKEQVKFLSIVGGFTADKNHLEIDATAYIGALKSSGSKPRGVLGSAEGVLLLDWNKQEYSVDVKSQYYGGVFTMEELFQVDAGAGVVIQADASLSVPNGIPVIGGKKIGEADFLFKYEKPDATVKVSGDLTDGSTTITNLSATNNLAVGDYVTGTGIPDNGDRVSVLSIDADAKSVTLSAAANLTQSNTDLTFHATQAQGFVAGWTTIDLFFTKVQAGIQYDFEKNKVKTIGHKTISNLKREATQPQAKTYQYTQSFTVPDGATQATFSVDWDRTFPAGVVPTLTIQGDGISDIPESDFDTANSLATAPTRRSLLR